MAQKATLYKEECLKDTYLRISDYLHRMDSTSLLITWNIPSYSELEKNRFYFQSAIDIGKVTHRWTLKLIKVKGTLFVIFSTTSENLFVHILIGNLETRPNEAIKIGKCLYVKEFCRKVIEDPKNKILIQDILTVNCRYAVGPTEQKFIVLPYQQRRDSVDVFQMCDDILHLFKDGLFVDFTIHVGPIPFQVHKLILSARSLFFEQLFATDMAAGFERKEMDFNDTQPFAMKTILYYIYSAEWNHELSDGCMVQVFHLAYRLMLYRVLEKCSLFFEDNLTLENAMEFYEVAVQYDEKDLQNAIYRFLYNTLGDVKKTEYYERMRNIEETFRKETLA